MCSAGKCAKREKLVIPEPDQAQRGLNWSMLFLRLSTFFFLSIPPRRHWGSEYLSLRSTSSSPLLISSPPAARARRPISLDLRRCGLASAKSFKNCCCCFESLGLQVCTFLKPLVSIHYSHFFKIAKGGRTRWYRSQLMLDTDLL